MQPLEGTAVLLAIGMALIFLCKFALAQTPHPSWIQDKKTGCKIWDNEPIPNESVTWSGSCKGGFATGFGVLVWLANGKFEERDEGVLLHGQENGQDIQTFFNGDKSIDQWTNGVRSGKVTYIFANGDKYVGGFKNGQFNGLGIETYPSGDKYVGEFTNGLFNGQGTYTTVHGYKYVGEFKDGYFSGEGTETFSSGGKHFGEFSRGLYNGQGTEIYVDGSRYVGDWLDDKRNGKGTLYSSNGKVLHFGIWKDDRFVSQEPNVSVAIPNAASNKSGDHDEIPLHTHGGVFEVPVNINGAITLNFIIDSGSADVSIPVDVVLVMLRTGTLTSSDFLGTENYVLADGSAVPSQQFRIRSLKVGRYVLENIVGSVGNVNAPLLLGQSFLTRFKSWSIDNNKHALEIQN